MTKIEKDFENSQVKLALSPLNDKNDEHSFSGDGGVLHLWEVENQTGFIRSISKCIND
ncbi:MAG: hypothetical protein ACK5IQ_01805 [Bacteroidales bacterium]